MEEIFIPDNLLSYKSEIFNKIYPDFFVRRIYRELRNRIQEICYVPVWNNSLSSVEDWEKQKTPVNRFDWIENYNLILPQSNEALKQIKLNNQLSLSIKESAGLISQILIETNSVIINEENLSVKSFVDSGLNYAQWKQTSAGKNSFYIINPFVNHLTETKPAGLKSVLLHGSLADGLLKAGFSDFDVHYIIDFTLSADKLVDLMRWIFLSNKYLLNYNPFMHHGPMLVLESELMFCSESTLPSTVIENGVWLIGGIKEIRYAKSDFELIEAYKQFNDFFANKFLKSEDFKSIFDVIWWVATGLFLPLLNIQLLNNKSYWKRDVLVNRKEIPMRFWDIIDKLTEIRDRTSEYVLARIALPLKSKYDQYPPGYVLNKYKNQFQLKHAEVNSLGITDELIQKLREYHQYCAAKAVEQNKINYKIKGYNFEEVNNHWITDVCEVPEIIPINKYQEVRTEFLKRCKLNENVIAVYEFGSVGCPGLSDLDFLVVLSDNYFGIPSELLINSMSLEFADIMNHNPVFISESQVNNFGAISPIFHYNQILGDPLHIPVTTTFSKDLQEVCFTVQNISKYPSDLISLSKQKKIRWKTLLAFLNSFNHVKKTLLLSTDDIPVSVQECIDLNVQIRKNFSIGICTLEDLDLAFEKMIIASIDVVLFYQNYWENKFPELKSLSAAYDFYDYKAEVYKAVNNSKEIIPALPLSLRKFLELTQSITQEDTGSLSNEDLISVNNFLSDFCKLKNNYLLNELSKGRKISSYITPKTIIEDHLHKYCCTDILLNESGVSNYNTPILFTLRGEAQKALNSIEIFKKIKPEKLYVFIENIDSHNDDLNTNLKILLRLLLNTDWKCELKTKIKVDETDSSNFIQDALNWFFENEESGIICESGHLHDTECFYSIENLLYEYEAEEKILGITSIDPVVFDSVNENSLSLFTNNTYNIFGTWRSKWKHFDNEMSEFPYFISDEFFDNNKSAAVDLDSIKRNLFNAYCDIQNSFFVKWNFYVLMKNSSMVLISTKDSEKELRYLTTDFSEFRISKEIKSERIAQCFYPDKMNVLVFKSEAAISLNNLVLARDLLNIILKLDENNLDALNNLAVVETIEDNLAEAFSVLKKILLIDPENEVAIDNLRIIKGLLDEKQSSVEQINEQTNEQTANADNIPTKDKIITLLQKLNPVLLNNHLEQKQDENPVSPFKELKLLYSQIKSVVIVRLDAIGDSLLFVNSVKQIKEIFPKAAITYICYKETEEIISRSPYIDIPVYLDRNKMGYDRNYRESVLAALRNYSFDILINPLYSREFMSEEIVYFINAELKIGFKGDVSNISPVLLDKTDNWYDILLNTDSTINKFELHRNAELVNLLGGRSNPDSLPELFTSEDDSEFILKIISNYKLDNYALVFPGSKGGKTSVKYWGSENFAAIIDYIQTNLKLKVVLLGGTDEEQICSEIISLCKTQPVVLQGQFSLWKSVELLKHAEFYFGSDTSIAHFSAALNIQTIVLLGGGHFKRFFPYPEYNHVKAIYKELSCFNCNWKCTQETNRCIKDISINEVKQVLKSLKINNTFNNELNYKTKNTNLTFNTGSKPKIDLLLPPGNNHSWHLKEAWAINLGKLGLLNRVFYTDLNNYQHFFDYLKKGTNSDFILALGGDHHLHYLHDSQQKIELWQRYKKSKVCYSYESTTVSRYDIYKARAENASGVFTHFLIADENDIDFYKQRNKKAVWFPQFVDEKFFLNYTPFDERLSKVFFKGKLWSEYKQRQNIIYSLNDVKLIELVEGFLSNSELVSKYNKHKAVINPPGVFGGFNVRTFESLAAGNLLFQFLPENRPLNNGLFKHFEHLIYFKPNDTSVIKYYIRDFLNSPDSYKAIAESGYNEVLNFHTIEKRLKSLLDFVSSDLTPQYPNYGLPDEKVKNNKVPLKSKEKVEVNTEIKLSAIVSIYNSERFIEDCLKNLVEQTLYKKNQLEIILVNTGSEQNEDIVIEKYLSSYSNIKYIKVQNRETIYSAWNRGIKAASGKYLTNANTDDRHKKDALEIMCTFLDNNNDIDVVYADQFITINANDSWERMDSRNQQKWAAFDKDLILFGCFIGPQPVWNKRLHDKFGLFNDQLKVVGDYEFWLRISRDAKFYHLKETLGIYYFSPDSAEHRDNSVTKYENKMIQEYYLAKYVSSINEIEILRRKIKSFDLNSVTDEYVKNANELISKREEGIYLEKEMTGFLNSIKKLADEEIIEKAKYFLQKMENSDSILNRNDFQESINTILGFYYLENNYLQESRNCFENILDVNNTSSVACEGLGKIFMMESEFNSAKTMLEWAVKNNPQNFNAIEALKTVNQNLSLAEDHNSLFENETITVKAQV